MKIEIDANIELELPEGADPAVYVKWWIGAVELLTAGEEYCVGWSVMWEPVESYP